MTGAETISIRAAGAGDTGALVEFNQAMAMETEGKTLNSTTLESGVEAVLGDARKGFYVVADAGGVIAGGLMVTFEWSDWRSAWFWWIQSVYVLPAYRGRGIYAGLYAFVKQRAADEGNVCGFRLYVEKENKKAQKVYEKQGMAESHYLMFEEEI
jgi:GNAT superfamily N-acetyltransferase